MRKLGLLCGAMLLFAAVASAQEYPKAEVFGGYSYLRVDQGSGNPSLNANGGSGSLAVNANSWLGVVADFGVYHATQGGVGGTITSYTFGPRLSYRHGSVTPFVHALFGGARISSGGLSENSFATAIGGGFDYKALPHISIRLIQGEYVMTRFSSQTQNNARLSAGVVFSF